jgi:hypothetical protein
MTRLITSLRVYEISIGMDGILYPGYEILTEQQIPTENSVMESGESLKGSP